MAQVVTQQRTGAPAHEPDRRGKLLRQRYSPWQRLRANLYGRLPLLIESLVALSLIVLVVVADVLYYATHGVRGLGTELQDAIGLLTLNPAVRSSDQTGTALFVFNVLFSLVFIQSILGAARAFFNKRQPELRERGRAAVLRDHVIVCGMGRMGLRLTTRLVESGTRAVVVERNPNGELVPRAQALRVPVVTGDARDIETLRQAGLLHARAIVACIDGDLADVEIALAARAANPHIRVILRAFNEDFDRGLERRFGPHSAFSASALAAPTFAAAAAVRNIEHVVPLDSQLLAVTTLSMPTLATPGPSVRQFEERFHVRVLHIDRSGAALRADSARIVATGDHLRILATLPAIRALYAAGYSSTLAPGLGPMTLPANQRDHIIICGLGKVGYRVVGWLSAMPSPPHITTVYLDDDEHGSFARRIGASTGVKTVIGDARDAAILLTAGLSEASVVAALTSDDLTNLRIALEARRIRPDVHIVLRVFSDSLARQLVDLFGIHTTYSTSELASPTLAAASILGGVSNAFISGGTLYSVGAVAARDGGALAGHTIESIAERYAVVVAGIRRNGAVAVLPPHGGHVEPHDDVIVAAPLDALTKMRRNA
ncbi:MAG TPA: NAD-binding protein [Ktedonobacterales bacterium]|nr:NAD-binding protein [Ktedonobacterales bacterium]